MIRTSSLLILTLPCLFLLQVGCGALPTLLPPATVPSIATITGTTALTASPTGTSLPTFTLTFTPFPTDTFTPTLTITPTNTPTITLAQALVVLSGTVLEHSNCRYGPGAVFLYKYGILPTSYMEVIGRDEAGTWLLIRAIGGDNPCWLKATLMNVRGDVMSVAEVDPDVIMPWSPYYSPLTGVSAARSGNVVTVFWDPLFLKAGDDSLQTPYLIEAWVCSNGKITFTVVGSWTTAARVTDEPGCSSPSHGRVYGAEKHGYTRWVKIPWP